MTISSWDKMKHRGEQNGERRRQCGVAVSPGLQSAFKIVFPGARGIAKLTKHKLFMQETRDHSPPRILGTGEQEIQRGLQRNRSIPEFYWMWSPNRDGSSRPDL